MKGQKVGRVAVSCPPLKQQLVLYVVAFLVRCGFFFFDAAFLTKSKREPGSKLGRLLKELGGGKGGVYKRVS